MQRGRSKEEIRAAVLVLGDFCEILVRKYGFDRKNLHAACIRAFGPYYDSGDKLSEAFAIVADRLNPIINNSSEIKQPSALELLAEQLEDEI